jgi:hypothetical protein
MVSFSGESTLSEALEQYEKFLRAVGYCFDGHLDLVDDDAPGATESSAAPWGLPRPALSSLVAPGPLYGVATGPPDPRVYPATTGDPMPPQATTICSCP